MVAPLIPIAAGVGSFLLAKASGASNRDALVSGGIGALSAYGLAGGQFGTGKALFTGADAATKGGLLKNWGTINTISDRSWSRSRNFIFSNDSPKTSTSRYVRTTICN